jgi:hypothetical protein
LCSKIPLSVNNVPIIVLCFMQVLGCRFAVRGFIQSSVLVHADQILHKPQIEFDKITLLTCIIFVWKIIVNIEQNTGTAAVMSAVL